MGRKGRWEERKNGKMGRKAGEDDDGKKGIWEDGKMEKWKDEKMG